MYRVGGYICQLAAHLQSTALLAANQSRSLSRLFTLTDICVSRIRCSAWPTFGMKHRDKPHTEVCATHGSNLSLVLASLWTSCKTTSSVHFSRYSLTITTTAAYTVILFQQMSGQIGFTQGSMFEQLTASSQWTCYNIELFAPYTPAHAGLHTFLQSATRMIPCEGKMLSLKAALNAVQCQVNKSIISLCR
jgi:hypothetical protein